MAYLPAGYQVTGGQGLSAQLDVVALDADSIDRRRARAVRVRDARAALRARSPTSQGFSYVAIVEAAPGGLSAVPVFVGRVDRRPTARGRRPLRAVGGTPMIPPGALVFALDGRFIGLVLPTPHGGRALVPAAALEAAALALTSGGKIDRP